MLLGSTRLAYWKLNGPGGEKYLKELGLSPSPSAEGTLEVEGGRHGFDGNSDPERCRPSVLTGS